MRHEEDLLKLLLETARQDDLIRAVILNGSRANPNAPRDIFQDFDIVYLVTDVAPFRHNLAWIERFGERMILQLPDAMEGPPPADGRFTYLIQFADGLRVDLTLYPLDQLAALAPDSQTLVLLDKDQRLPPFPPPSDRDHWPQPPSAQAFADCCNEFWWVCPYVAKGLWREEIVYAKHMLDQLVRDQLFKMLVWYVGVQTQFTQSPGKYGKYLQRYLEPELWALLQQTYADASYAQTWRALQVMGELFRRVAGPVAAHFGYPYPRDDDERVSAHLQHVQTLPRDATSIY